MSPTTDTSEKGLETLIVNVLTGQQAEAGGFSTQEISPVYDADYLTGDPHDYDREHAVDAAKLFAFLQATQPEAVNLLQIGEPGTSRTAFLHRLQGEIAKRGIIDVL